MLVRMWNSRNSHSLLMGRQNGTSTSDDSLVVSNKTKHTLTIWSSNHTSWYLPKGVENLCPHRNLHMDVYSSFIHNCHSLEATRWPLVGEWVDKLWSIQTMEYYSGLKRNELSSNEKTWRKLKCILQSERSQSEKAACYMILIMWQSGKAKLWRQ